MNKRKNSQQLSILLIFALLFSSVAPLNMGFAENVTSSSVSTLDAINVATGSAIIVENGTTSGGAVVPPIVIPPRESTIGDSYNIVKWDITAGADLMSIPATGGEYQATAPLLTRDASYKGKPTFSSSSLSTNTWDNGAGVKYWQASFSTKHFKNIKISSSHRSSGTGPRDFQLQYSLDGVSFNNVDGGAFVVGNALPLTKLLNNVSLPEATGNQDKIYVRWLVTSNTSAGGTNPIASGGAGNINSVLVTGSEMVTDLTPISNVASGLVGLGTPLSFTNGDPASDIVYALNNDTTYVKYSADKPLILAPLPMTVKVKAVTSAEESRTKTYVFQQAKVEAIIPNKFSGKILADSMITLKSGSQGAIISYIVTKKEGLSDQVIEPLKVYNEPIKVTADMFPVKIEAVANINGYLSSNPLVLNYTQKIVGIQKLYFGQLHSHTSASDGIGSPREAFAYAKEAPQIDFLAITDHSNYLDKSTALGKMDNDVIGELATGSTTVTKWKDGKAAAKELTDGTFVGMYAYEMTWSGQYGHMNTFNSTGFVSRNDPQYVVPGGAGLKAYYDLLKGYPQTISQFNHPGSTFGDFQNFGFYSPEIDKQVSLIEVGNGEGAVGTGGYFPSYDYYQRALDKGWHVAPTNNQDNHKGKWGDANTARTVILTDDFSESGIYTAMSEMKVYATEDNNIKINYSINGEVLGTVFEQKPNSLDVKISVEDPDLTDKIERVSIIANGGVVVATKAITDNKIDWNVTLDPSYSYYYVRVEEADKDSAVTAPIWVGEVTKIGIGDSKSESTMHVVGEEMNIVTNVFNNESSNLNVSKIEYVVDGEVVGTETLQDSIGSLTNKNYNFKFTPKRQGKYDVNVKVTASLNKTDYSFNAIVKLDVIKLTDIVNIAIDGAHSNFYVTGNYKDSDLNFISIAGTKSVRVTRILTEISDETLKGMSALVLSTPERHTFSAYVAKNYTEAELAAIKKFADNGGNIILTSTGERLSGYNSSAGDFAKELPENERAATISNNILAAIGATTRFNDDEVVDPTIKSADIFRLAFTDYNYASNSPFLKDVQGKTNENFSFYSGNSLNLDPEALASGKVEKLITGSPTAKGVKWAGMATTKTLKPDHVTTVASGCAVALASEKLPGGGFLLASGVTFFSNFEVKVEVDNSTTLQNSNYAIVRNVLDLIKPERPITPIATVQKGEKYDRFMVQGVVASNASGYDKETAFFDCIYIQDSTGGINLFPVAGNYKIGDTVKVTGLVGEYQGEKQLTVESIEKIDVPAVVVIPTNITTKESMDSINLGKLLKVSGRVVSIIADKNMIKEIVVNDGTGNSRIFVDGYITAGISTPVIAVNDTISAVGFSSVDTDGSRLRVRDRAEILLISKNPAKAISSFNLNGFTPAVVGNINESAKTISLVLPYGTNAKVLKALTPSIIHDGASISPATDVVRDFTTPQSYIVTAANGTTATYIVSATIAKNSAKAIKSFEFKWPHPTVVGNINEAEKTITLTVPYGTYVKWMVPKITQTGVAISPESGHARDFRTPQSYTVRAEDGTKAVYVVTVIVKQNPAKAIRSFSFKGLTPPVTGMVNESKKTIKLTVPYGTDIKNLVPSINHEGQSVSPMSNVAADFTTPQSYTITAADGTIAVYVVSVSVKQNPAKAIESFNFNGLKPAVIGNINESFNVITLTVPHGTNLKALVPTITQSGSKVSPPSGEARDFRWLQLYTVTAEDGSKAIYLVKVFTKKK